MQDIIETKTIISTLFTLGFLLAALWFGFWAVSRSIKQFAKKQENGEELKALQWANELTRVLRRTVFWFSVLIAVFTLLYGVGLKGLPRWDGEEVLSWLRLYGIPIVFICGSAWLLIHAINLLLAGLPNFFVSTKARWSEQAEQRKRIETRAALFRWVSSVVIVGVAILMVLRRLEVDLTPILAGGALLSVALGLGAQNLVRDLIGGLFLILEDQVRVGDIVSINGKGGQVEQIQFRTISLRGVDGTVHIFPNGSINEMSNLTKGFSYYVIDLGVAYKESVDSVMEELRKIGVELENDQKYADKILAPLDVMGVDAFAESAVVIRVRIRTVAIEQWNVGRELRRRIKNRFDELGIEIPYPHVSVYFGNESKPFDLREVPGEKPELVESKAD